MLASMEILQPGRWIEGWRLEVQGSRLYGDPPRGVDIGRNGNPLRTCRVWVWHNWPGSGRHVLRQYLDLRLKWGQAAAVEVPNKRPFRGAGSNGRSQRGPIEVGLDTEKG